MPGRRIQTRFFSGFAGSSFLSVAGGTVSDVFTRDAIQGPMTIVALSPFIGRPRRATRTPSDWRRGETNAILPGPSLGPLIGGFINYNTSWRWTYYVSLYHGPFDLRR